MRGGMGVGLISHVHYVPEWGWDVCATYLSSLLQSSFLSLQFRKLRPREKNFRKNTQELSGNLELENVQTLSASHVLHLTW